MSYWVYIVLCADGTLYAGITTDLVRRLAEHNGEKPNGAKYTLPRRPVKFVYQSEYANRSDASRQEFRIKQLSRLQKEALITSAQAPATIGA